ncbi:hypothetical protein GCM10008931_44380 [Oceanobacillus oncorhynchi subsp. oncorhynchi]|uniref:hypothetical protein n=1 Tax=Oceanobacillus oncorhynchi TaxID=545501 RepID=UPI0031DB273C
MKITTAQLEELYHEESLTLDSKELSILEKGEWEQDHKFQTAELIFTDGEKFYRGYIGREGSPFTDWTYTSEFSPDLIETIDEVEKKSVTIEKWVKI